MDKRADFQPWPQGKDRSIGAATAGRFRARYVTFQSDVVDQEMGKMNRVMMETIGIVMGVVVLFLGWRAGVIVGSIVPLTILGTLIAMRALGVELQTVSMAAIIIRWACWSIMESSLQRISSDASRPARRVSMPAWKRAQSCHSAADFVTGHHLCFFAVFLRNTQINDYLRSLVIVLALTLLGSWVLCLTVTPLLCYYFLKMPAHEKLEQDAYDNRFYRLYRRMVEWVLDHKLMFMGGMAVVLVASVMVLRTVPESFLRNPIARNSRSVCNWRRARIPASRSTRSRRSAGGWTTGSRTRGYPQHRLRG